MAFYDFNLPFISQWPENSHMVYEYTEPTYAAAVQPLSPGVLNIHEYHCDQYNVPANENYQFVNYNQHYYYQDYMGNTIHQPCITKQVNAKDYKKSISSVSLNQKRISKPKRHRTVFKIEQVEALEMFYKHKQFVTLKECQQLQEILKISNKTIKVWFQNRRLKDRRESKRNKVSSYNEQLQNQCTLNDIDLNITQEIDKLTEELQQKQEKDDIDDFLLNVIKNPNNIQNSEETSSEMTQQIYYESISPAGSCEELNVLQNFDSKEMLKTFLNFPN